MDFVEKMEEALGLEQASVGKSTPIRYYHALQKVCMGRGLFIGSTLRNAVRSVLDVNNALINEVVNRNIVIGKIKANGWEALDAFKQYRESFAAMADELERAKAEGNPEIERLEQEKVALESELDRVRAELAGEVDRRQKAEDRARQADSQSDRWLNERDNAESTLRQIGTLVRETLA